MKGNVVVISVKGWFPNQCGVEYIGRKCGDWKGSVLGNPFPLGLDKNRDEVIRKYKMWLWEQFQMEGNPVRLEVLRLMNRVLNGEIVVLGCWCHPLQCHCDVVKSLIWYLIDLESWGR